MSAQISFNPQLSTNAAGTFGVQWDGLIQGTAFPDPAVRYALSSGYLASTETLPMWGGVAISEDIPAITGSVPNAALGGSVIRANDYPGTDAGSLTGFSVFDQAYGMVNTPQSPVPLAGTYGQVNYYRLGSGARIVVAMDSALASLGDAVISSQVSWDFTNQKLIAFSTTALPVKVLRIYSSNCMTVNYDGVTGFATWNRNGAAAVILI